MSDDSLGSISMLFQLLQDQSDADAATKLWQRFFPRLLALANKILSNQQTPLDAEDAVQEAFIHFFRSVQDGRYEELDRDDLWRILSMMTVQKARKQVGRESALKRGGGRVLTASQLNGRDSGSFQLEHAIRTMPTAEWDIHFAEMLEQLSDELREVAIMRLAGYSNPQIRDALGCSLRSVERRLQIIRATWAEQQDQDGISDSKT